jgi:hypothetical protein
MENLFRMAHTNTQECQFAGGLPRLAGSESATLRIEDSDQPMLQGVSTHVFAFRLCRLMCGGGSAPPAELCKVIRGCAPRIWGVAPWTFGHP